MALELFDRRGSDHVAINATAKPVMDVIRFLRGELGVDQLGKLRQSITGVVVPNMIVQAI